MDAIPPPIQSLLALFADAFADVRFGDIDGKKLASSADEVAAAAAVVAKAEAALEQAREILNSRQDALLVSAHRALAYARVYAEADDALMTRVAAISLPKPRRAKASEALVLAPEPDDAPPRRRGRPRKEESAMNGELLT